MAECPSCTELVPGGETFESSDLHLSGRFFYCRACKALFTRHERYEP